MLFRSLDNINLGSTATISEISSAYQPKIYPNPNRPGGILNITNIPASDLRLFDSKGKMVWLIHAENNFSGEIPTGLKAGSYLLQIESSDKIWNYKIVLN